MSTKENLSDSRSAFTLIEIMVAAVITIIMIGLVIQITSGVLNVWNRSVGKLSANAEARIAMELLTSDLETALLVNNGQQWLRVESETDVGSPDPVGQTVALKLFAPAQDRPDQPGNICAIAYRLAYDQAYTNASTDTFVLYRDLEGPVQTFETLLGPATDEPQLELTSGFWARNSTVNPSNFLAGNIVDFKVYIYGTDDSTGDEIVLNASGSVDGFARNDEDFDGEIDLDYIYGGTDSNDELPTSAEIFLTVVSDEGLDILNLLNEGVSGTGYDDTEDVIREHGEVFRRRVFFQGRPL